MTITEALEKGIDRVTMTVALHILKRHDTNPKCILTPKGSEQIMAWCTEVDHWGTVSSASKVFWADEDTGEYDLEEIAFWLGY